MRDELPEELTRGVNGFVVFVSKAKYDRLAAALESISNGEGAGGLAETERLQEIARAALAGTAEHQHTDACWEPDSGCDMGRSERHAIVAGTAAHETLATAQRDNLEAGTAEPDEAIDYDGAVKRIEACVREIQILCDHYNLAPEEWLQDEPDLPSPADVKSAGRPEPRGTFACPICGVDTPHGHPEEAIRRHRNGELQAGPLSRDTMQLLEDAKNGVHGEMAREVLGYVDWLEKELKRRIFGTAAPGVGT